MIKKSLTTSFKKFFGSRPEVFSSAPGRVNIIGEHTDYNLGYVLPAAINFKIYFLVSKREDERVYLWAENYKEGENFSLKNISSSKKKKWANYVKGILWLLEKEGLCLRGINGLIYGDIPFEAGLSSSAALEVSVICALDELFRLNLSSEKKAFLAQKAENEFVGVKCGLMDQFISIFGRKNRAMYLDCETLNFELIPLNLQKLNLGFFIYNSRVQRELASSGYNLRRQEAEEALFFFKKRGFQGFKEVNVVMLEKMRSEMKEIIYKRAKHIISENKRVREAVQALKEDNFILLGKLLFLSHESLRDDYEVSCPELDLLYETGKDFPACLGARLTGAGFGGSGVALIKKDRIDAFKKEILNRAVKMGFNKPEIYEIKIGDGAKAYSLV